jgi:transposase
MSNFVPFNREQAFLLPPDLKAWLPEDDLAHFVVAAVERVPLGAFAVPERTGGKPQYHPRLILALLIYSYANGIFSSRRIERATWRDIAVRFVAANLHPDHDTIAAFRRLNKAAFEAAFLQVLLLARESGLLRLGTVSIDGTKIDANASKIRSVRYDRAKQLRAKLAADIADLTARAETADAADHDPQALPAELARREALKAKLDAPAFGWRPRRGPRRRPPARLMRRKRPPMTPRRGGAAGRAHRPTMPRRRSGRVI